jgi:parallel beta-helix repeat protein
VAFKIPQGGKTTPEAFTFIWLAHPVNDLAHVVHAGISVAHIKTSKEERNMQTKQNIRLFLFAALTSVSIVAISEAASLACGDQTISAALRTLQPGDTLPVSGACNENLLIPEQIVNVILDGQGTATINGPDASRPVINVRGTGITIRNFAAITGGDTGITVTRGGTATIESNIIENAGNSGISISQTSSARIVNNKIQGNAAHGILINDSSSARVGFLMPDETVASPNLIQNNGENGIIVTGSSNARVVGNTIRGNAGHGVIVNRVSHADVSSNTLDSNGGDGVFVTRNSGVNLGEDTGNGIFDSPNTTNVNNGGFGIRCLINSYGDGRRGTLDGASGALSFAANCTNATSP